jgi:3-hydroxyisobutyrate dehydrogenase-like beta-hydroxyacid dehydrogenase
MLEPLALGRKLGFLLTELLEILNVGEACSGPTRLMLPALIADKPATNFGLALMVKDLHQATTLGRQYGVPMPVAGTSLGLLQAGLSLIGKEAKTRLTWSRLLKMSTASRITGLNENDLSVPPAEADAALQGALAACNATVTW